MSKTSQSADAYYKKLAPKKPASPTPDVEKTNLEAMTARVTVLMTPSQKLKLQEEVLRRRQLGDNVNVSDVVRELIRPIIGD